MGKTLFFGVPVLKSQPKPEYPRKKVVALDFDGVLNSYSSGWKGATETDGPVPGAAAALRSLWERGYKIVIYSTRAETLEGVQAIRDFLAEKMDIDEKGIEITDRKPIAEVYVDDRAINFAGDWDSTLKEIFGFESWVGKSLTFSGWKLQGRTKIHGMDISIENRKGSVRRGKDKDGHAWETKMHYAYGYIRGTVGKDKDHLDCYIGPNPESRKVFIVHQNDPTTGKYDEDKCMLGFDSAEEAKAAYLKQYDRPGFFGSMEETDIEVFKEKALSKENHGKRLVVKKSIAQAFGVDPELVVGIQVEKEHTDDTDEARKIALDHLKEDPKYYSKLIDAGLVDEPKALWTAKKLGLKKSIRLVVPVVR